MKADYFLLHLPSSFTGQHKKIDILREMALEAKNFRYRDMDFHLKICEIYGNLVTSPYLSLTFRKFWLGFLISKKNQITKETNDFSQLAKPLG